MKKKTETKEDDVESVEVDLIRVVERLRAMRLGRYACKMWDGSTVRIEIKSRKPEPSSPSSKSALSWEEKITAWLKKTSRKEVTIAQIFDGALGLNDARERTRQRDMRVVECLRRLGWTRRFLRDETGRSTVWKPPR